MENEVVRCYPQVSEEVEEATLNLLLDLVLINKGKLKPEDCKPYIER